MPKRPAATRRFLDTALLVLAALIWGMAFVAQKGAAAHIGSFTVVSLRSFVAALALVPVICLFDRLGGGRRRLFSRRAGRFPLDISRREFCGGILCGFFLGAASVLQQIGLALNDNAGKTAFITSLYIVFVPALGILLGRRTPWRVLLGVAGAVLGAFVLSFDFSGTVPFGFAAADILVFLCAILFAGQILSIDHFAPGVDGVRLAAMQFLFCGLFTLPPALLFEIDSFRLSALLPALLPLLYLGIFSSGVAYTLQIIGQQRIHPAVACSVLSLESVFGMLGGVLFGETPGPQEWLGSAIVFISVIYTQLSAYRKEDDL